MSERSRVEDAQPSGGLWVTARWVGAQIWWSQRLFTVTGGWVPAETDPAARIHLAGVSRVLGEHVGSWARHLPVVEGSDPHELVVSPTSAAGRTIDRLAGAAGPDRLAGLHRVVLPHLIVTWGAWEATASGVADAPALRTLRHARADLRDAWEAGEAILQTAGAADSSVIASRASFVRELEMVLHRTS